jgi:serine/threonine protein kinase
MKTLRSGSGKLLTLGREIGKGGEGCVWTLTSNPELVLKYYRQGPAESEDIFSARLVEASEKIPAMIARPPKDPNRGHISIAWPIDIALEESRSFAGFLMPYMQHQADLIYNFQQPKQRRERHPAFTRKHSFQAASNLASAVSLIHHAGHVVGDMNPANILCRDDGLITFIDTDSFQIAAAGGKRFRCCVGIDDWIAPELQGKRRGTFDWTELHDRFALAVHIFDLLVGFHPFNGVLKTGTQVNRINVTLIEKGVFPYVLNGIADPPPAGPARFARLSAETQAAFIRTFHDGAKLPSLRLSPGEWIRILTTQRDSLIKCQVCGNWSEPHATDCFHCSAPLAATGLQTRLTASRPLRLPGHPSFSKSPLGAPSPGSFLSALRGPAIAITTIVVVGVVLLFIIRGQDRKEPAEKQAAVDPTPSLGKLTSSPIAAASVRPTMNRSRKATGIAQDQPNRSETPSVPFSLDTDESNSLEYAVRDNLGDLKELFFAYAQALVPSGDSNQPGTLRYSIHNRKQAFEISFAFLKTFPREKTVSEIRSKGAVAVNPLHKRLYETMASYLDDEENEAFKKVEASAKAYIDSEMQAAK